VVTLTYVYAEQTAVLGPLATFAEPHSYDLCSDHGTGLTAPRGWDIVRLDPPESQAIPTDDLVALAEAVRERRTPGPTAGSRTTTEGTRRPHLRVLRDQ
jgi:hypothetical protein